MANHKGNIVTITSTKGGVGKTALTLILSYIYSKQEKSVLIIDLDLCSGGIATALNKEPQKSIYHMTEDFRNNRYQLFKDYVTPYDEKIDILASPKDPRQALKINGQSIEMILNNAKYKYDIILVDTTHALAETNLIAMDHADVILDVMTNDPLDLKNTKSLMAITQDAEMDNVKVVLNNARDLDKNYFSIFDIKNVIKANIDYTISQELHLKDFDRYIMEGSLKSLSDRLKSRDEKGYKKLIQMSEEIFRKKEIKEKGSDSSGQKKLNG